MSTSRAAVVRQGTEQWVHILEVAGCIERTGVIVGNIVSQRDYWTDARTVAPWQGKSGDDAVANRDWPLNGGVMDGYVVHRVRAASNGDVIIADRTVSNGHPTAFVRFTYETISLHTRRLAIPKNFVVGERAPLDEYGASVI
jgi:hypothetical protein